MRVVTAKISWALILVVVWSNLQTIASQPAGRHRVLHYAPEKVTLKGTLVFRTFYGPPNYGENPRTDSKETQSILLLDDAFAVVGDKQDPFNETERGVSRVTLVFSNPIPHSVRYYLKRRVTVEGTLFHGFNGHHRTKILITVSSINRVR
jgi:uncharacterized protein DUF4431